MPTPFLSTMFVVMTTLNGAGQLAPVDPKTITPPEPYKGYIFWSADQCMYVRGKMEHPEKYVCQVFRGPKEIDWEFKPGTTTPDHAEGNPVADPSPGSDRGREGRLTDPTKYWEHYERKRSSFIDVAVGPSRRADKDIPVIGPYTASPAKPVKRVAAKQGHYQRQPQNPFELFASLFTPRGDW
jgi:hypothetical protein